MIIQKYHESTQKDPEKIDKTKITFEVSFFYNSLNKDFELFPIKEDYEQLILKYAPLNCRTCNVKCGNKAICILCQNVICPNTDCCRNSEKKGEATWHALECNGGAGYFIHLYYSQLIGICMNNGALLTKIYNNDFGEDYNAKLNENRYIESPDARNYKLNKEFYYGLKFTLIRNQVNEHIMQSIHLQNVTPALSTI